MAGATLSAQDIKERVETEIAGIETNAYGWKFRPHLLAVPQQAELKDSAGGAWCVWVVLRESANGYWVIFDPEENEFGLATGGIVIGLYGGFLATLDAM